MTTTTYPTGTRVTYRDLDSTTSGTIVRVIETLFGTEYVVITDGGDRLTTNCRGRGWTVDSIPSAR